jgi:hypothetical protein
MGRLGGHTDIVGQTFSEERHEPSGHLKGKELGHESVIGERHSSILLAQAPFQQRI